VIVRKNVNGPHCGSAILSQVTNHHFRDRPPITCPPPKPVQLSLDVKGLDVLSGAAGQVQVPSKGDAKLDWRVKAKPGQDAALEAKALTDEESDAMEITLPVIAVGVKQTDAKSGSLVENDQEEKTVVTLPGNPDQSSPALDITLNSSYAGSIFEALDYLTSYPYGLHGTDDVELPSRHCRRQSVEGFADSCDGRDAGSQRKNRGRHGAAQRLPARGRWLGLVEGRRESGIHDLPMW